MEDHIHSGHAEIQFQDSMSKLKHIYEHTVSIQKKPKSQAIQKRPTRNRVKFVVKQ